MQYAFPHAGGWLTLVAESVYDNHRDGAWSSLEICSSKTPYPSASGQTGSVQVPLLLRFFS